MGLELKQFGQTLAVGAFAMLGLWLLLRILLNVKLKDLKPNGVEGNNLVFSGILLAFLFSIGIVLENISKHIVADRDPPNVFLRTVLGYNLKKDKETRFDVLFDKQPKDFCYFFWRTFDDSFKANTFYNRLYCEKYFKNVPPCAAQLVTEKFNLDDSVQCNTYFDTIKRHSIQNITNILNNDAKDRVFLETNYYTELIALTSRMDFLRAFIFLATVLIYLNLIIVIPFIFYKKVEKEGLNFNYKKIGIYFLAMIMLLFLLSIGFEFKKQLLIVGLVTTVILIFYFYKKIPDIDSTKDNKDKTEEQKEVEVKQLKDTDNNQKTNNILLFTALCFLLSIVLPTAYEAECSNYNRRVLGYHLSLIKKEGEKSEEIKKEELMTEIHNYYSNEQSNSKINTSRKSQSTNKTIEPCSNLYSENKELKAKIKRLADENDRLKK